MVTGFDRSPWRLLELPPSSGARHMALDHALLEAAASPGSLPSLRFQRWSPPALSVGRFQPLQDIDLAACRAEGIEVVRRPTGGKSILHLDDFTYSVVIPQGFPLPERVVEAYRLLCGGIVRALEHLGVRAAIKPHANGGHRQASGACFAAITQADLEYHGRKLCGSAQVRRGGALLQHGSILLEDHSELLFRLLRYPEEGQRENDLRVYRERCMTLDQTGTRNTWPQVADAFLRGFREFFAVEITRGRLSARECERWETLAEAYGSEAWLRNAESRALPAEPADKATRA